MREETEAETEARASKDEAILVLLSQLSLVYWRPDFSPGQARQLYMQFLEDLREWAFLDIRDAIRAYRRDPDNKFFPTPGQLRGLIEKIPSWNVTSRNNWLADRRRCAREEIAEVVAQIGENKIAALTHS